MELPTIKNKQIQDTLQLIQEVLGEDLLGMYLYGSAVIGGLQRYSDIDLFVVTNRETSRKEKETLVTSLLGISGIYMKEERRPIELTIVNHSEINPWRYPAKFDFQYGEWLRDAFENGNIEPWAAKEMPDLAILITQVLLGSQTLAGAKPEQLLSKIPNQDIIRAQMDSLPDLISEVDTDTRNVLLTLARIWSTVETDTIRSKPDAADWAIERLDKKYRPVIRRAKDICIGNQEEHWEDLQEWIRPCVDDITHKINQKLDSVVMR